MAEKEQSKFPLPAYTVSEGKQGTSKVERDSSRFHQWTLCKMTDDTDLVNRDSTSSPEFIGELLLSAERAALLYHLSYLRLQSFPKLERLIRKQALETQQLFGSSEAFLLKCAGTSDNIVTSLLPNLKVAVEKNKPDLALKFLEEAKEWIGDVIIDVKDIVKRYDEHNRDVAALTSDIITVKKETEEKLQQQTSEMKVHQKIIDGLEAELCNNSKEKEDHEKKIDKKISEIREYIKRRKEESTFSTFWKMITFSTETDQIMTLDADINKFTEEHNRLKEQEWDIQKKLIVHQLKMAKLKMENYITGQMASVTDFDEVQQCLTRIQETLVQLQKFWEKVGTMLDTLKKRTFAGEDCIEELTDMKEEFLESIDAAQEEWTKFGISCMKANNIFSVKSNEAYRFLEISPSSLSGEEWQKEFESVKEKLQNIRPNAVSPAALTQ